MANVGLSLFQIGYELSPIILTNGIATPITGNMLPIIAITQAANFTEGLLNGSDPIDPNNFLGHFRPMPGSTLIDNEIGDYPFANQAVAANAIITRPLRISMLMLAPANQAGGYAAKLISFTALKAALDNHNNQGGTYTVATPAYVYTNCILLQLRDVSNTSSAQPQNAWQFDFIKPLLTIEQAQTALGSAMAKVNSKVKFSSTAWSGIENTIGLSPKGSPAIVSGTQNLVATAVSSVAQSQGQNVA